MSSHYEIRMRVEAPDSEAVSAIMMAAQRNGEVTKVSITKVVEFTYQKDAE